MTHGGKRAGAGRKPLAPGGAKFVGFTLTQKEVNAIACWQREHDCKSASEALRQIIERSTN